MVSPDRGTASASTSRRRCSPTGTGPATTTSSSCARSAGTGRSSTPTFAVDFREAKLGRPHHMQFGQEGFWARRTRAARGEPRRARWLRSDEARPRSWIAGAALAGALPAALAADPAHTARRRRRELPLRAAAGGQLRAAADRPRVRARAARRAAGDPTPLLDLRPGEAALVSFVYLSCGEECPLSTATLHRLDRTARARRRARAAREARHRELRSRARYTRHGWQTSREHLAPKGRWQFLTGESAAALAPVLADFGQDSRLDPGRGGCAGPAAPRAQGVPGRRAARRAQRLQHRPARRTARVERSAHGARRAALMRR